MVDGVRGEHYINNINYFISSSQNQMKTLMMPRTHMLWYLKTHTVQNEIFQK